MRLIDADRLLDRCKFYHLPNGDLAVPIIDVQHAPTIEPERKKGEWIEDGYSHYKAVCSECGEPCATYVMNDPRDRFCKWCGANMRGEQE